MSDNNSVDASAILETAKSVLDGQINGVDFPDIQPAPGWLIFKVECLSSDYSQRTASGLYLPENKDDSHFLKCKLVRAGADTVPAHVTHIHVMRGGYPKGALLISAANGHGACKIEAVMGWESSTEPALGG